MDVRIAPNSSGSAGVYHENDPPAWNGVTDFYHSDFRSPLGREESKTWEPMCVWAGSSYPSSLMYFTMRPGAFTKCDKDSLLSSPPPRDRRYLLELIQVPDGVVGAPEVGTVWELPLDNSLTVTLPTYKTTDGLTGYQFAITITEAAPGPGDFNNDGDVDGDDYWLLEECLAGPDSEAFPGCDPDVFAAVDMNHDTRVDLADYFVFSANFTGGQMGRPPYVGATQCIACHPVNHHTWLFTRHASAFGTLVADGEGDNPACLPCHSVGYGESGGFLDIGTTRELANVQCENCHGPGGAHSAQPYIVDIAVDMDADLCGGCHRSCHGMCGDYYHPTYEQWSTSKHSKALSDIRERPDFEESCLGCHSTDYRLAPEDAKPTVFDVQYDIECTACHDPHGGPNDSQLRWDKADLCAQCHTLGGAAPDEQPDRGQAEMIRGTGGYRLDGVPLDGSNSAHYLEVPDRCVVCHVHREAYEPPTQAADSGHNFVPDMKACGPCHHPRIASLLVESAREEIESRVFVIRPYFNPNSSLYLDPSGLDPDQRQAYGIARFNYEFVTSDRSFGTHNINYARMLLGETESLLGITP